MFIFSNHGSKANKTRYTIREVTDDKLKTYNTA